MGRGHVEVLLTEKIHNLGAEGEAVAVKRGFARNFLLPQGKALELNPTSLRQVKILKAKRAEREAKEMGAAQELAAEINKLSISLELLTGEKGKAFGSITVQDIFNELSKQVEKLPFDRHQLSLERPIKSSGTYEIPVKIHPQVTAIIHVNVVGRLADGSLAVEKQPTPEEAAAEDASGSIEATEA